MQELLFRLATILGVASATSSPAFAQKMQATGLTSVKISVQSPSIVRETASGAERLWYLDVVNASGTPMRNLSLRYVLNGHVKTRKLLEVRVGGALDTLWLPASLKRKNFTICLVQGGDKPLWRGSLPIAPPAGATETIRRSKILVAADLKPLSVRGTNYYPPGAPWGGLWQDTSAGEWEVHFKQMADLHVNAVRTFYLGLKDPALQARDGAYLPPMISKINRLLEVAARNHIKVMLCLDGGGGPELTDLTAWKRRFRTGIEPFIADGRILMWDLINEPGGSDGPKASPELMVWMRNMYLYLQELAPHHLNTVGLTWQFDQLWDLGIQPDVGQYHNYSGAIGVRPVGDTQTRSVATDLAEIIATYTRQRPLLIGEFGFTSRTGTEKNEAELRAALDKQTLMTRSVLEGAEAARIAGVMNWCAFEFVPDWMGIKEKNFGVIKPDGILKPAGVVLRETYARWKQQLPALWDVR